MPVSFKAHTVIMVLLSCKLQLVCFFYVLHFLLRSISIYQTTDGKRDSHSLLLKSSSVCAQRKLTVDRLHFFSPPSIRQSYRKWWVRRKLRMFPPHPLPLLNLLRVKHQSPQRHRYNTRCFCQTWNWHHQHVCQMGDFFCLLPVTEKKGKGNILPVEVL